MKKDYIIRQETISDFCEVENLTREALVPYFLIKELEEGFLDGITGTYKDPDG